MSIQAQLPNKIKKQKLVISFLLIIVLFLSFGLFTIKGLLTLGNLTRTIYDHPLVVSNASLRAALSITKMHRSMKDAVLADSSAELATAVKAVAEAELQVQQQLDVIRKDIVGKEGQALEKQTRQLFANWQPIREKVLELLKSDKQTNAIHITQGEGAAQVANLEAKMLQLSSYARAKADSFIEQSELSQKRFVTIIVCMTLAGIFFAVCIAIIAIRSNTNYETEITNKNNALQKALDEIKILTGIVPICSHCKQIRDDKGMWKQLEAYIQAHSETSFSHSICPDCARKHYPEEYAFMYPDTKEGK